MASSEPKPAGHLSQVRNNTHPQWWQDPGLRKLNMLLFGVMLGSVNFGFDQSLISGLKSDTRWYTDLGLLNKATLQGLVVAAVSFGVLLALFPAAFMVDFFGRRWTIIIGNVVLIVGAIGQAFTNTSIQFLGTRILLGFFSSTVVTGSVTLLSELAHPRQRAPVTAMYNTCFYIGSITAAWSCYGSSVHISSSWVWRIPVLLQIPWALLQLLLVLLCPESPRWLAIKGRESEAKKVLAKYHANGVEDDELVELEYQEILATIRAESEEGMSGWRGWVAMVSTRANLRRTFLVGFLGLAIQWVGNGVISYYLSNVLDTVGVTSTLQQQGVNGGLQVWNWIMSVIGALLAEKAGRKLLMVLSCIGMLISMVLLLACSAVYQNSKSHAAANAVIVWLFFFNGSYDIGFTPIPPLYVAEIAPTRLRAKYISFYHCFSAAALCFNQFVNSIAMTAIGWKYYIVYVVFLAVSILTLYFFAPETKGLTLEEVAIIFDSKVAAELERATDAVTHDHGGKTEEVVGASEIREYV